MLRLRRTDEDKTRADVGGIERRRAPCCVLYGDVSPGVKVRQSNVM